MPKESTGGCNVATFLAQRCYEDDFLSCFLCLCFFLAGGGGNCRKPSSAKKGIYLNGDPFALEDAPPQKLTCPLKNSGWKLEEQLSF